MPEGQGRARAARGPGRAGPEQGRGRAGQSQASARVASWSAYSMRSAHPLGQALIPTAAPTNAPARAAIESESPHGGRAPGQCRDRVVGVPYGAEQRGRQGLLGDPTLARGPARVTAVVRLTQGVGQSAQHRQALVPTVGDELLRGTRVGALPEVTQPPLPVDQALGERPLGEQRGKLGQRGARAQHEDRVRGQLAGGQPGRVPMRQPGLQLGQAGERVQVDVEQPDRGDPHVGAAPLRPDDGGVLPAHPPGQLGAGAQAGHARGAVVVRADRPGQETLPQQWLHRLRGERGRLVQRPTHREGHLGVVGDQCRLAGQLPWTGRTITVLDLGDGQELGRLAERVTVGEAEE